MAKRISDYHRPEKLADAVRLLAQPNMVPLAGGTKLLAAETNNAVVDLQGLGLNQIQWQDDHLLIGATAKLTDLTRTLSEKTDGNNPAKLLQKSIRLAGPNTYRNAATIGGTIASRLSDNELLAALLVLETTLTLHSSEVITINLAKYLSADERPNGLITQITVPWVTGVGDSQRVARTPADMPIVSVTIWQPAGGAPKLAATGVGARPTRLSGTEKELVAGITESTIDAAASAAKVATNHPGDFRGDTAYRTEMAAVLTRRVCEAIM